MNLNMMLMDLFFLDADGEIFRDYVIRYLRMLARGHVTEFDVPKELYSFVTSEFDFFGLKYFDSKPAPRSSTTSSVSATVTGNRGLLTKSNLEYNSATWFSFVCSSRLPIGLYRFEVVLDVCVEMGNSWGIIIGVTSNSQDFNANIRMTGGGYIGFNGHRTNGNNTPSDLEFGETYGQGNIIRCEAAVQANSSFLSFYKNGNFQGAMSVEAADIYVCISASCNVALTLREL